MPPEQRSAAVETASTHEEIQDAVSTFLSSLIMAPEAFADPEASSWRDHYSLSSLRGYAFLLYSFEEKRGDGSLFRVLDSTDVYRVRAAHALLHHLDPYWHETEQPWSDLLQGLVRIPRRPNQPVDVQAETMLVYWSAQLADEVTGGAENVELMLQAAREIDNALSPHVERPAEEHGGGRV